MTRKYVLERYFGDGWEKVGEYQTLDEVIQEVESRQSVGQKEDFRAMKVEQVYHWKSYSF